MADKKSGIYIVQIITEKGVVTKKVVKKVIKIA